jgi:hypothetical protein
MGVGFSASSPDDDGIVGVTTSTDKDKAGVRGLSTTGNGVIGVTQSPQFAAVSAVNDSGGIGMFSRGNPGGHFESVNDDGVFGTTTGPVKAGVRGESATGNGVLGVSRSPQNAAVSAVNDSGGIGVFSRGNPAGHFEGNIEVLGDIRFLNGNDVAEHFAIADGAGIEVGTVVVIGDDGQLLQCRKAYDKRVAGVISGAGHYKPAIILGEQPSGNLRRPVALVGRAFCRVDAQYGQIEVGDLLTTSPTPGHAMKAGDPLQAFGAVIGKALRPLDSGKGLVPILISLQ